MNRICFLLFLLLPSMTAVAQSSLSRGDSLSSVPSQNNLFFNKLDTMAQHHKVVSWLHSWLIRPQHDSLNYNTFSYDYYRQFEGKIIASIKIRSLDVFGPTLEDTTLLAANGLERLGNKIHTKSNLNAIRKNLLIKVGDMFHPQLMIDNERLLRELPYLQDVRVIISAHQMDDQQIDILILTKDVFAFGVTGELQNTSRGAIGIYNKNVFGIGHEIQTTIVANSDKEPKVGFEAYYLINNIQGSFIDFNTGYMETYLREGFLFSLNRQFLSSQTRWAGGFAFNRYKSSDRIDDFDPVETEFPLNFSLYDGWFGYSFQLKKQDEEKHSQLSLSARVKHLRFFERPVADGNNQQYFANSSFYLGSLSLSKRKYTPDHLIYSYGITEDIPRGYLHELVVGYDKNEFRNRWYSHLYLSSGNLFDNRLFYLYGAVGVGCYFNKGTYEQGHFLFRLNYISRMLHSGAVKVRQFIRLSYLLGFRRLDIEKLDLTTKEGIRGFTNTEINGQQRLTANLETVFFQNKEFLKFKTALFAFMDLGIVGSDKKIIFTQNYYTGIGFGVRLRNENLVFNTIQIRLAVYPNYPAEMGIYIDEQGKTRFYNFQPQAPTPLRFK